MTDELTSINSVYPSNCRAGSAHWNYKEPDPEKVWDCGGKERWWETYCRVNEHFKDVVMEVCKPREGDVLWVHDYHLMLLPSMVRRVTPLFPRALCPLFRRFPKSLSLTRRLSLEVSHSTDRSLFYTRSRGTR